MRSSRDFTQVENMYGVGRTSRGLLDPRDGGITVPHSVNSMPRRQLNVFGGSADERASRGKAAVDEDRLGRDGRIPGFLPKQSRGFDQAEGSGYGNTERRSGFKDELGAMKLLRSDDAIRGGGGGDANRLREGAVGGRVERTYRSDYADEPKWVRHGGKYGSFNNYDGVGSLRSSGSDFVTSAGNSHDFLPGFIFESPKRMILDWTLKGTFALTFDDRRLAEQVGPGTKVFLFDGNSRELYGVFQSMGYAIFDLDSEVSSSQVRVRAIKDCLPLLERDFKEFIRDNYYTNTKFTAGLSKEQVAKLMQCFRPVVDAGRSIHSTSSRSSLHSGLVQGRQDFHGLSDDIYGKEDRRRAPGLDTRTLNSHAYHGQDGGRFSSKVPIQVHSSKGFSSDAEAYGDEVILPLDSSAMAVLSRGKQQSVRSVSGSRTTAGHNVTTGRHADLKVGGGDWRDDDTREVLYRKRHAISSNALDDLKRGNTSSSPSWKEVHQSRAEVTGSEVFDRVGKGGYKEEVPYVASTRHVRNDIDLNIPLDMGHGEPSSSHVHDVDSKIVRRRVWEEEDDKSFVSSPPKGRSVASRGSDYAVASSSRDDFEELSPTSEDVSLLRVAEKGRPSPVPVSSTFLNGKTGKSHARPLAGAKALGREKPGLATLLASRRESVPSREVVHSIGRDFSARNANVPVFKIKANLQAPPGKGRAERVVTLLNTAKPRQRFVAAEDDDARQSWKETNFDSSEEGGLRSDSRKRKASVWSRINLPPAKPFVKKTPLPYGKGRVFSRLGPAGNSFAESRDNIVANKKKKIYPHQNLVWTRKVDAAGDGALRTHDARLAEDDVLADDSFFDVPENREQATEEPQGWSRKKSQVVSASSGDEGGNLDAGEPGKGGRRKIVRPTIGGRFEDNELGDKFTLAAPEVEKDPRQHRNVSSASGDHNTFVQQGSPGVMMDIEMNTGEAKDGRNSFQDSASANAAAVCREFTSTSVFGGSSGFEADNMMS
ncbi:hypothetical protein MPTK1_1g14410 [Marchantia polymorpha subsp. ruderalis]|uniref:DCD domain-containing protein n=2 Tax=Marchantia polymorpha TaxID=3197 RepID=A0AAF6AQ39_MARPO|nr:hypothetical protein MARPO_0179s0022 [Marchantia polymorpha]PTQ27941.1 hypothetical protein MARPO_0179s0022 [Marchantia polymorpha]BBM98559.1 hypothetical protein Mp_1g14410 [Marchantia polymorpha subsp. ruderalis]BBM98560.1 hypothetical protein Mp_1g14410 [Marchantia polymorpha subsp. ruderalis]|eukprot:PTQ27940.1 hypothetical protein MARPO_0179s0022 [Marchantia polymorpha]